MVTNLIESDEKTTKYLIENKILGEKEQDLNMNLRNIIMNSQVLHKIRSTQNPNLLSKLVQKNSRREESTDSSEEKQINTNRKEDKNDSKENEVFISNSNLENKNKVDKDLKFTFSPIRSITLSKIDSQSKTKNRFFVEELKNKEAKNINFFNVFNIQDLQEIRENDENLLVNLKENKIYSSDSPRGQINDIEKQLSESVRKTKLNNILNSNIPFEIDKLNLRSMENKKDKNKNQTMNDHNRRINEKQSILNQSVYKLPSKEENAIKRLSINFANNANKIKNANPNETKSPNQGKDFDFMKSINKNTNSKGFEKDCYSSKESNKENNPIRVSISRKIDDNHLNNTNNFKKQNLTLNPLGNSSGETKKSKDVKSIEEFKKLRARRINHSIISPHSIIDYSINKSDYTSNYDRKMNNSSAIHILDKDERERSNLINEKIKIGNEKIKELISKTKDKGHFGPYFSLCRNCNERNNQFYDKIDAKNAIGILNAINHN